jgi:hypothetical protein
LNANAFGGEKYLPWPAAFPIPLGGIGTIGWHTPHCKGATAMFLPRQKRGWHLRNSSSKEAEHFSFSFYQHGLLRDKKKTFLLMPFCFTN